MNPQDPQTALEELIVRALDVLEDEGEAGLEALLAAHPEWAEEVRSALSTLELRGLTASDPEGDRASFPERLGGYELVRPLGGGGMGIVYLARDAELGREVALKLVRPDQLHFPGARERFRREVRTIARLQHAGIVPLFGVGEDQGVPFYAMEHVRGCTLAEVVRALADRTPEELTGADLRRVLEQHADGGSEDEASPLFDGSWESVCLRIVREVAEALEYAHRRGVVHRDVKPSNVMLTPAGRVQLFDFGLSSQRGGTRITRTGSALGSLAYMAPEMLRGQAHEDDPRLDVYSLGVTLFELLTLTLPFPADSEGELRRAVLEGGVVPPVRKRNPRTSWEAEALCQVATDPDAKRRYASAGSFAQDITSALESRPLAARPPGAILRARRWLQRNPVAAVVLFALVVGPSVLAVQEYRNAQVVMAKSDEITRQNAEIQDKTDALAVKNVELGEALAAAEAARGQAEENFDKARQAVDRMLTEVASTDLQGVPRAEEVRRRLLDEALGFHEWFLAKRSDNPELRIESAYATMRATELYGAMGLIEEARQLLSRAEKDLRALVAETGDDQAKLALVGVLRLQSQFLRVEGELEAAGAALEDYSRLLHTIELDAHEVRNYLGVEQSQLAKQARDEGDNAAAEQHFSEAITIYEELLPVSEHPDHELRILAESYCELGAVLEWQQAAGERVLAAYRRAAEHARELTELHPKYIDGRFYLGRSLQNQGVVLLRMGRLAEAEAVDRQAYEVYEELVADFPRNVAYKEDYAGVCAALAGLLVRRDAVDEGLRMVEKALGAFRELGAYESEDPRHRASLGVALVNLAISHYVQGEIDESLAVYEEALTHFDAAVARAPVHGYFAALRRECMGRSTTALVENGRFEAALEHLVRFFERAASTEDFVIGAELGSACLVAIDRYRPEEHAELVALYGDVVGQLFRGGMERFSMSAELLSGPTFERLWDEPAFVNALDIQR